MTGDMADEHLRPYFLWDEDRSIAELKAAFRDGSETERVRLLAKLLREARDIDVWHFVSPDEVARALPAVRSRLGRRRKFWEFLIDGWRRQGLLGS
jgi:hypothetical protein